MNKKFEINRIFNDYPLYAEYELNNLEYTDILSILFYEPDTKVTKVETIDSYCTVCNKETSFISRSTNSSQFLADLGLLGLFKNTEIESLLQELRQFGTFTREFYCPRASKNRTHDHVYVFKVINGKLIKIGQTPSIASLTHYKIKKYRKLGEDIYEELNRANGLSSHGIGIGAFVYLRRIIEKYIVIPILTDMIQNSEITKEEFDNLDFKNRVQKANRHLPDFLIKNPHIYSILSKGIHELSEEDCKACFPIVEKAIEILLDERIEKIEKDKKIKEIEIELNKINK